MCLPITWAKYTLTDLINSNTLGEISLKLSCAFRKYSFFIAVYSDLSYNKGRNNYQGSSFKRYEWLVVSLRKHQLEQLLCLLKMHDFGKWMSLNWVNITLKNDTC